MLDIAKDISNRDLENDYMEYFSDVSSELLDDGPRGQRQLIDPSKITNKFEQTRKV
jgi:hypothetical protein